MPEPKTRTILLASASPRRRMLMEQIGVPVRVAPVDVDETPLPGEDPARYVERLARAKARAGLAKMEGDSGLSLGSDTTVVLDGRILGKPADRADAEAMLERLSGSIHQVMTAVALAGQYGCFARLSVTEVRFRAISPAEIRAYCDTGEYRDKAGAYGIQGRGGVFVTGLSGSYSAVVGLPLEETAELFAEAGVPVWSFWESVGE